MALGYARNAFHVTRVAEDVGGDDGARVAIDARFDRLRVQIPAGLVDVGENRTDTFPLQRAGGGHEAERGRNGAARQTQRTIGDLQRQGAVVSEDDVAHTQVFTQAFLQLGNQRAVIGQPTGRIDAVDIAEKLGFVAQVRLGDIDHHGCPYRRHIEIGRRCSGLFGHTAR